MPVESPKVCAVILNLGGMPVMEDCLRSLEKAYYPALEIIVVHNGPHMEGLEAAARSACSKISEFIFTGSNLGFAAGNNQGIRAALSRGADYVLLLNDDTFVAPDFIGPLVSALEKNRDAGMAGSRIYYASEPKKIWSSGARLDRGECGFNFPGADQDGEAYGRGDPEGTDYATGCAALVSRKLTEAVGMLDESFFLYWEDSDWGLRAAEAGFMSLVVPASKVWHKVSYSSGGDDSALKLFHKTRGRLLFARRHCPGCFPGLLRRLLRDAAWLAFKSGKAGGFKRAAALLAGTLSYFTGGRGPGPAWLTERK
jgi:GT2 family glycosyltransferase